MKNDRGHDESMAELFQADSQYAADYLSSVLADGDQGEFLIALRQLAKAFGGVTEVAAKAKLNPTQLYRTLSPEGNPELSSFTALLQVMGMRLTITPMDNNAKRPPPA